MRAASMAELPPPSTSTSSPMSTFSCRATLRRNSMASMEPGRSSPGMPSGRPRWAPTADEGGLEAPGLQVGAGDVAAHAGVVADLDAFLLDELRLAADDVAGQPVLGDAHVHHAARHGQVFEDDRLVARRARK